MTELDKQMEDLRLDAKQWKDRALIAEAKLDACKVDGFRDGFSASGEGWNGEYGADIEEVVKEYADELRDN